MMGDTPSPVFVFRVIPRRQDHHSQNIKDPAIHFFHWSASPLIRSLHSCAAEPLKAGALEGQPPPVPSTRRPYSMSGTSSSIRSPLST